MVNINKQTCSELPLRNLKHTFMFYSRIHNSKLILVLWRGYTDNNDMAIKQSLKFSCSAFASSSSSFWWSSFCSDLFSYPARSTFLFGNVSYLVYVYVNPHTKWPQTYPYTSRLCSFIFIWIRVIFVFVIWKRPLSVPQYYKMFINISLRRYQEYLTIWYSYTSKQ